MNDKTMKKFMISFDKFFKRRTPHDEMDKFQGQSFFMDPANVVGFRFMDETLAKYFYENFDAKPADYNKQLEEVINQTREGTGLYNTQYMEEIASLLKAFPYESFRMVAGGDAPLVLIFKDPELEKEVLQVFLAPRVRN